MRPREPAMLIQTIKPILRHRRQLPRRLLS
jgi:hypothetical protein